MGKTAIIIIPEDDDETVQLMTNDVSYIKIVNILEGFKKLLAQRMVAEATRAVGSDPKKIEDYLDQQNKIYTLHAAQRKKGLGGFNIN